MTDTATVRLHASKIARQIQLASNATKGDEKAFREKVAPLFEQFADDTKIDLRQHDEYTLVTGRADTVYNRLVIEYEHPEFLRVSNEYANNKHAIQQVKDYIEGIQKHERQDVNRLVGAVLDGYFLIFVRHVGDSWRVDDPLRVDAVSVEYLLELLVKTSTGVALIPDNLIEDFGSKTLNAQRATRALYHALDGHRDDLVAKLFEQWQTFFGEVTGYEEGSARLRDKKELRAFAKGMGISPDVADPPRLFFAVHTYFA
ncbi:MAG: hypothetical protein KGJ80_19715, partial [Chloroflexota bacterium]|nr:hypothetical protein [Chloroflexota bacterium]